jgi:ectoine hydroxylase-related dioxygenase (phytanoyl-CoA dioxygenase family)
VHDFVNRGPAFDRIYVYGPLLAACCRVLGRPFKLSTMLARTLEPRAPGQPLHVDFKRDDVGWPMVGFILMVEGFRRNNGATRFAPGSHLTTQVPGDVMEDATAVYDAEALACGPAGS